MSLAMWCDWWVQKGIGTPFACPHPVLSLPPLPNPFASMRQGRVRAFRDLLLPSRCLPFFAYDNTTSPPVSHPLPGYFRLATAKKNLNELDAAADVIKARRARARC